YSDFLLFFLYSDGHPRDLPSFPTRRSSDLRGFAHNAERLQNRHTSAHHGGEVSREPGNGDLREKLTEHRQLELERVDHLPHALRSEEHTSELQSRENLVCRLLLEKKNT